MTAGPAPTVAIIGGGFTGTMLAAQLARRGVASMLVDGSGRMGRGVAYSTDEPAHLLNVRAEAMSAWADAPMHFADRFAAAGGNHRDFAPRRFYGRYLGEILDQAIATGCVERVDAAALSVARNGAGWMVTTDDGRTLAADAAVLASGNQSPADLRSLGDVGDRYIGNPWGAAAKAALADLVENGGDVLFVGTGLTMIDLVLSLESAGFSGRMMALSRRGLVPRAHTDVTHAPVALDEVPLGDLVALTRWLRRRSAAVGWRAAVDSLRPHSHRIWQSLGPVQQHRFMRHARAWWDVHRHRIAPEVAAIVKRLIADQRLEVVAGRLLEATGEGGEVAVTYARRGGDSSTRRFAYIFNCTGPLGDMERTRDPLLRGLLDHGIARADPLGIGLAIDGDGRVDGAERLWAAGPLTKSLYWEIVAVPDIRVQVAAIADDIAKEFGR